MNAYYKFSIEMLILTNSEKDAPVGIFILTGTLFMIKQKNRPDTLRTGLTETNFN